MVLLLGVGRGWGRGERVVDVVWKLVGEEWITLCMDLEWVSEDDVVVLLNIIVPLY